jgi:predicted Zn-dependent protease
MKPLLLILCALPMLAQQGMNLYSIEKEIALGDRLASEIQQHVTLIPDARVDRLGGALAPKTSPFRYRFPVFDGPQSGGAEPGAVFFDGTLAVPGGTVFVPRSLLAQDDPHLAAILAHAIAHVELRHGTRLLTRRELSQIGERTASIAVPEGTPAVGPDLILPQFSRNLELAADRRAVQLLHDAGFNPAALLDYRRTLPEGKPSVVQIHPDPARRIEAVEKAIADLPQ